MVPPFFSLDHVYFYKNAFSNSKKALLWKLDVSREKLIVAFLYIYSPCCAFCALHKSLLTHFHLKSLFCHLRALLQNSVYSTVKFLSWQSKLFRTLYENQYHYWKFAYVHYFAYVCMISFRSTCWLCQTVYEREFLCLNLLCPKGKA